MLIQDRLVTGRLKILETCPQICEEFRRYHRDENGKVVPLVDDLIDCLRYALTGLQFAKTKAEAGGNSIQNKVVEVNFYGTRRRSF